MPIYVYQVINEDGSDGEVFEYQQSMQDAPLSAHPVTQAPVKRVYQPPNLGTRHTAQSIKNKLDPKHTEKAGFTRYERDKLTGTYHKVSGKDKRAPETFKPPR